MELPVESYSLVAESAALAFVPVVPSELGSAAELDQGVPG